MVQIQDLVFFDNQKIPYEFLKQFSSKALWKLIHRNDAKKICIQNII